MKHKQLNSADWCHIITKQTFDEHNKLKGLERLYLTPDKQYVLETVSLNFDTEDIQKISNEKAGKWLADVIIQNRKEKRNKRKIRKGKK